jgi:hypothetical protein
MSKLHRQMIWEIGEVVLPPRRRRSNPRGVKRKMSAYKLRSRATQKAKALNNRTFQIIFLAN